MHHSLPLITTVALGFALALIMGFIAVRFKISAIVGYLLAGIIIGPFTPGLFADVKIAQELAEIGIMLLMFGVGLHFSLEDLKRVRSIAIPGAVVQMIAATLLGGGLAVWWGWDYSSALIFGLSLSVASTVVLLRALEERGALDSINGHIAVGWLLVEDLAMVVVLVLLPSLSHGLGDDAAVQQQPLWVVLSLTLLKVLSFIILMFVVGRRLLPKLLWHVARTGSRELFTLCVITAAISIAYGAAQLFGVSFALGAFFAGMILRESSYSHRAAEESLPLRDAFAVLFFVSVGMLFNPMVLFEQPLQVLSVVGIIIIGKSIAAFFLVLAFRYPLHSALIVSASLAQIGEFSFILAELGIRFGMLPEEGRHFILAGALISIALNPLIFRLINPVHHWVKSHPKMLALFERENDPLAELPQTTQEAFLAGQVVLVGYGRVGKRIANLLTEHNIPFVVVDENREIIAQLRETGIAAVYGDASEPSVLIQGHIARASMLMIVVSDTVHVRKMIACARALNPDIEIVVRSHDEEEALLLQNEVLGKVFFAEGEIAGSMGQYALNRYGKGPQQHT
ncbi:Kef family K(+) transporter [Legionella taurinensis]|uniref:Kef family K(+) transporter n=1 Tax=Legionella taurinensis TaxID=70611 RepID=A0A3A5LD37_9GAMM|nr:YbaL family putative K(+) efflux transporter [Legionella taurinensis]MDX1838563.1 YbaL family putative K(+) efflux transporter [Legionella taurinensis]PUT39009.1 Kef family K(+) transporter [Legionella taurinensis]PUT41096.1 Kef family K(+) transporter [Legionella taurinensis]PUT43471.1 Kef family K(+) transporter [Legionella taurinensis]PUT46488.1 Kef family K(+) transporter [Legionella taurinensis]